MGVSRRGFLSASAAALSASLVAEAQDEKEMQRRTVGPQPVAGSPGLLIVFEGLCAFVTNPPGEATRKVDVGLLSTKLLVGGHPHVPTLGIDRSIIKGMRGIAPAAATVQDAFFSLKGQRVRIVPKGAVAAQALSVHDSEATDIRCPSSEKRWMNFNWLLDFHSELDGQHDAALLSDWRKQGQVVDALIELRHGSVEDEAIAASVPGSDSASVYALPAASGRERALKEKVRVLIGVSRIDVEIESLASGALATIELDAGDALRSITVSQLPVPSVSEVHNMMDLKACWLLTDKAARAKSVDMSSLPKPLGPPDCNSSATSGCGCCPAPRYVERVWKGR